MKELLVINNFIIEISIIFFKRPLGQLGYTFDIVGKLPMGRRY
jgi:hypothetical protein